MKIISLCFLLVCSSLLVACKGDSEDDLSIDCSKSTLEVSIVSISDAECNAPGVVVVSAEGGVGDVAFSANGVDFQVSATFNLSAGNRTITARDNNCSATVNVTVNASENAIVFENTEATNSGCGATNGSISISASGGVSTLMYSLDNGIPQTSPVFTGVSAGNHLIKVEDGTCSAQISKLVLAGTSLINEIMPIIAMKCAINGCHNGDNGGIANFNVKANVINLASTIKEFTQSGFMPQTGSLTNDQKALIACWVDDGALDN